MKTLISTLVPDRLEFGLIDDVGLTAPFASFAGRGAPTFFAGMRTGKSTYDFYIADF